MTRVGTVEGAEAVGARAARQHRGELAADALGVEAAVEAFGGERFGAGPVAVAARGPDHRLRRGRLYVGGALGRRRG